MTHGNELCACFGKRHSPYYVAHLTWQPQEPILVFLVMTHCRVEIRTNHLPDSQRMRYKLHRHSSCHLQLLIPQMVSYHNQLNNAIQACFHFLSEFQPVQIGILHRWRPRGIVLFITLVPKVFIIMFSFLLAQQLWGLLLNFD